MLVVIRETSAPAVQGRRLSPALRTALDVIRSLAATYVVVHHVVIHAGYSGPVYFLFKWGAEAVIVFFLLSGFVIFHNEKNRVHRDLRGYYLRRVRRIYPTLLLAFALSAMLALLAGSLAAKFDLRSLILNLASLQDLDFKPGNIVLPFLGNGPLWSLSYEVAFYLVFPLIMVAYRKNRSIALGLVGAASIVGYATYAFAPNHFSLVLGYLLTWWAGAVIADLYSTDRLGIRSLLPLLGWLAGLCAVSGALHVINERGDMALILKLSFTLFLFTLGCVVLAGTGLAKLFARLCLPLAASAAYVASISYGLYVFHYPILLQWEAAQTPVGFVVALVFLVVMSIFGDRWLAQVLPKPRSRAPRVDRPKAAGNVPGQAGEKS
jgi:peptidoglycan/LPS O-acetylase OafA/YrhL